MIGVVCKTSKASAGNSSGKPQYGRDVGGLLRYLYGPGKANEHENPHLVASWDGLHEHNEPQVFTTSEGNQRISTSKLAGLLTDPITWTPGMSVRDPHVYHLALSTKGGTDRDLTDEEWATVAADMMHRVGIAPSGDDGGCRWVAVRHGKSTEGNDHLHIVAVLARQDGTKPRIWGDFQALRDGAQHWEKELGLTLTADSDSTARKAAAPGEQYKQRREGVEVPYREQLSRKVAWAAAHSTNEDEFFSYLDRQGLDVAKRMSTKNEGEVTGYSVGISGHVDQAGKPVRYSGSKLDGHSLPKLRSQWAATPDVAGADPDEATERASTAFRIAAGVLRNDPDGPQAAGIAAAAGDSLSAYAAAVERAKGGPLTEIAQQVARAGRPVRGTDVRESMASTGLRQAGRALYVAKRYANSEEERVVLDMLASAMMLSDSIASWRAEQGKRGQVQAAVAATVLLEGRIRDLGGTPPETATHLPPLTLNGGLNPPTDATINPTKQTPKGPRK